MFAVALQTFERSELLDPVPGAVLDMIAHPVLIPTAKTLGPW